MLTQDICRRRFCIIKMEKFGDSINNQIAALLRVISVTRNFKDDVVPSKIEEGLFLGSIGAANNKEKLKSLNITHILTVANSLRPANASDFVCKVIPVFDKEDVDIAKHFDECFDFIDEARSQGGGVLIHCFVGRSRSVAYVQWFYHVQELLEVAAPQIAHQHSDSPSLIYLVTVIVTVTVAYLMKKHGMSYSQAMDIVREKRPQAGPNSGFIRQLMEFEKSLQPA